MIAYEINAKDNSVVKVALLNTSGLIIVQICLKRLDLKNHLYLKTV